MVAGAVLAGGASRRMGRDKATLVVGGVELASLALAVAARVADPVVLVAPEGHPARRLAAAPVADPGRGPLAALAAALGALDADHVLVLAGDHPGLRVELLAHLVALAGRRPVADRPPGRPAHPGRGGAAVAAAGPGRPFLRRPRRPGRPGGLGPRIALGCGSGTASDWRACHGPGRRARAVPGAGPLPARAEPAGGRPRRGRGHPGAGPGGRPHL